MNINAATGTFLIRLVITIQILLVTLFSSHLTAGPKSPILYCVDPDWMPYEAIRNNKHVGISADYIQLIEQYSKLDLKLLPTTSWQQTLDYLRQGKCEVASMLNQTHDRDAYLNFTQPYFESANVFVTKQNIPFVTGYDNIGNHKLGIVKSYRHAEYVTRYYPSLQVKLLDSESQGILALEADEIDIFIGSQFSVNTYIEQFGLHDLKIVGFARPFDKLRLGVVKNREDLLGIIDEAIAAIPESKHVEIFRRWNYAEIDDQVDYRYLAVTATAFLVLLGLVIWRNYYVEKFNRTLLAKNTLLESLQVQLLEQNKQLEFMSNHDSLTKLYNRHYMVKRCEDEIARMDRFSTKGCLIVFDIDHFKLINDQFGHSTGDLALASLADIVSREIRDIDVLARWGGEEFVILCPQTSIADCYQLVTRLQQALETLDLVNIDSLTCSFGIAEYHGPEVFSDWFERADEAMLMAKNQGRNTIVKAP